MRAILISAVLGAAVTFLLIPPLRKLALARNWLDRPQGRKLHSQPTPFVGGWAIFAGFWAAFLSCLVVAPELREEVGPRLAPIFFAHLIVFLGGVVDDFFDLKAWYKLLIQLAAAVVLFAADLKVDTIYVPFVGSFPLSWPLALLATILWLFIIVNALNVIDGLDGLAGGLSVIAAIGLLYTALALQIPLVVTISIIAISITLAFLCFNFPRATVFLGDSGSQSIGFIFAVAAIYCPIKSYTVVAMFVPLLTLGVPLLELATSFGRRLITGKSVVRGDSGHLYHVLQRLGWGSRLTVVVFWSVAAVLQVFVFTLFLFDRRIVFSILVLFMLIVAGWFLLLSRKEER